MSAMGVYMCLVIMRVVVVRFLLMVVEPMVLLLDFRIVLFG